MTEANMIRRDQIAYYRISMLGLLDPSWSVMLSDMCLTTDESEKGCWITTLSGSLADQAALMGVLNLVYDLGLILLLVERQTLLAAPTE